jgi:uncharacterized membrane protein YkvA (DUF1232 family)
MQFDQIRALIEEGRNLERQTGMLRQAVINLARPNARSISEREVENVVEFVNEYIEHAPALMQLIEEAAARDGVLQDIQPILDASEEYFLSPDDVIPDHLGMVGLVDDAYLTHTLMQAISDRHRSQSGSSLLPIEAHDINAFIRRLIGEPFVSILDDHVSDTLDGPLLQQKIEQMVVAMSQLNLSAVPDPIWGDAPASEIAAPRLVATGAFMSATYA